MLFSVLLLLLLCLLLLLLLLLRKLDFKLPFDEAALHPMALLRDELATIVLDATRIIPQRAFLAVALQTQATFCRGVAADTIGGLHLNLDEMVVLLGRRRYGRGRVRCGVLHTGWRKVRWMRGVRLVVLVVLRVEVEHVEMHVLQRERAYVGGEQ